MFPFQFRVLLAVLLCVAAGHGHSAAPPGLYPEPPRNVSAKERGIDNAGLVPSGLVSADFDRDGLPDMAVSYAFSDTVRWFAGEPGGKFAFRGEQPVGTRPGAANDGPRQLIAQDFDDDGFTDLLVVCSGLPQESGYPAGLLNAPSIGMLYGRPGGFEPWRTVLGFGNSAGSAPRFAVRIASGLFNSDYQPDIAVAFAYSKQFSTANGSRRRAYQFSNQRTYSVQTDGRGPFSILSADLRKIGQHDLILINERDVQLWHNESGQFQFLRTLINGQGFTAGALGDFDRNGLWDVAVADGALNQVRVLMNVNGLGFFEGENHINLPPDSGPVDVRVADADLDGRPDLLIANLSGNSAGSWLNRPGTPTRFVPGPALNTSLQPRAMELLDFNRDRRPDFAVVNEGDKFSANAGNEDVTFTTNTLPVGRGSKLVAETPWNPGSGIAPYLDRPVALAWDDGQKCFWTSDRRGSLLAQVNTSGTLLGTLPIQSIPGLQYPPTALAYDQQDGLWLLEPISRRALHITRAGQLLGQFSLPNSITSPAGIACDSLRNVLWMGDGSKSTLTSFTPDGLPQDTLEVDDPVLSLTYNPVSDRLWMIPAMETSEIWELGSLATPPPGAKSQKHDSRGSIARSFDLEGIAEFLEEAQPVALAIGPSGNEFHCLTSQGLIFEVENFSSPDLGTLREWRLLREIRGATRLPDGGWLLADAGMLATLARFSPSGELLELINLNTPQRETPVVIRGLAAGLGCYFVLDDTSRRVRIYLPDGTARGEIGMSSIEHRLPRGLLFDAASNILTVGTEGRLLRYAITPRASGQGVNAQFIGEVPAPLVNLPGTVLQAGSPAQVALFPLEAIPLTQIDRQGAITGIINAFRNVPPRFNGISAIMPEGAAPGLLMGEGDFPLIPFTLEQPANAVGAWADYL